MCDKINNVNWDEIVLDIIAKNSVGLCASCVKLYNEKMFVSVVVTVRDGHVIISLHNDFDGKLSKSPFFVKDIDFSNPNSLGGELNEEINSAMSEVQSIDVDINDVEIQ